MKLSKFARVLILTLTGFLSPHLGTCHVESGIPSQLNSTDRDHLRYHLENLFNEMDLLIKNQKVDQSDVKRQEKHLSELKVFERIPFKIDLPGLQRDLAKSSQPAHVKIHQFKWVKRSPAPKKVPSKIYTDNRNFHLDEDQIVEKIYFEFVAQGSEHDVNQWTQSWKTHQMRLVELDSKTHLTQARGKDRWKVHAHAFRFRDIQYPKLQPKNPRTLLPDWGRKNFEAFKNAEPLLSSFVTRIETLAPKTGPYYQTKQRFLLNDARLAYFISKAAPSK